LHIFRHSEIVRTIALENASDRQFSVIPEALKLGSQPHSRWSRSGPVQSRPPFIGGGLSQIRRRCCTPFPHGIEQSPHFVHSVQLPSTTAVMEQHDDGLRRHDCAISTYIKATETRSFRGPFH